MAFALHGKELALAGLLPNGTNRYVALMTALPNEDGSGGAEASGSSYARKAYSTWVTSTVGGITYRQNDGSIAFAALSGNLSDIIGWAIYDALTNGTVLAYGYLRDVGGTPSSFDFVSGDQPRFDTLTLQVGID